MHLVTVIECWISSEDEEAVDLVRVLLKLSHTYHSSDFYLTLGKLFTQVSNSSASSFLQPKVDESRSKTHVIFSRAFSGRHTRTIAKSRESLESGGT